MCLCTPCFKLGHPVLDVIDTLKYITEPFGQPLFWSVPANFDTLLQIPSTTLTRHHWFQCQIDNNLIKQISLQNIVLYTDIIFVSRFWQKKLNEASLVSFPEQKKPEQYHQ